MEINGVAHTFITASDFDASVAFYRKLVPFLGMTIVADARTSSMAWAGAPASGSTGRRPSTRARVRAVAHRHAPSVLAGPSATT